ncbi:MAG: 3-deoxy-manno-octulosonate cytidylyltransferase [Planctomycetes bacterium]|nr:3-deoxy-manno-octulosonate cytidylyltransferase [Planctomycetota bacterium]
MIAVSLSPVIAVIPARYASTRLPGKVLLDRTGKPLIQHVFENVRRARLVDRVIVATDDQRIVEAVQRFGGEAVMTRSDHPNGTSRIAEVTAEIDSALIVNVQADEPEIEPELIDLAIQTLKDSSSCVMSTLGSPFASDEDPSDPNIVKVVVGANGQALSFSRSVTPSDGGQEDPPLKHIGLYVYRRDFLMKYVTLPATPLEQAESLEQLRVLEHGYDIAVAVAKVSPHGIDTPPQYDEFVQRYLDSQETAP